MIVEVENDKNRTIRTLTLHRATRTAQQTILPFQIPSFPPFLLPLTFADLLAIDLELHGALMAAYQKWCGFLSRKSRMRTLPSPGLCRPLSKVHLRHMSTSTRIIPSGIDVAILTPQLKDRRIEKIVLQNGMKGVVISDPTTPTTGAALSVEAGSWSDGRHEGTAHFLEHMLFLGTEKYPSESDYERYDTDNGLFPSRSF